LQGYSAVPVREEKRKDEMGRPPPEAAKVEKRIATPREAGKRRQPGGKENLYRRGVKSPELAETSFTMSTIEEEVEGVTVSIKNLQDII
jgi:hypothetical protein